MTNQNELSFLEIPNQSSAQIISRNEVEVIAPDGEVFTVLCQIGAYTSKETQTIELYWLESLFDKNFSADKEEMINAIWRESMQASVQVLAIRIEHVSVNVFVKSVWIEVWKLVI